MTKNNTPIVFLQASSLGNDMDLSIFDDLGQVTYIENATNDEVPGYLQGAEIAITNKNIFDQKTIDACPSLKLIALTATGTNNVDLDYCTKKGIKVANVANYSTDGVAQLTVTMALALALHLKTYDEYVKSGHYVKDEQFSYFGLPFHNLSALTWGIVGLGHIGSKVAEIATSLGSHVIYTSLSGHDRSSVYERVDLDELLTQSDIISVHCPLTDRSYNLFNKSTFQKMKNTAILVNTARGAIVNEEDLKEAINNHEIYAAGLDTFKKEPLPLSSPLYQIEDQDRLILTPHVGWGSFEARDLLVKEVYRNIEAYLNGESRNIVNEK